MRVLNVVAELGSGGAEALVADLVRHRLGHGDAVAVASAGGWRAPALAAAGADLVELPLHRRSPARAVTSAARAARRLRGWRPDLVHAHNVGATLVAHLAARWPARRPPLLATVHGLPAADYARAAAVLRRTADLVVAVSGSEADKLTAGGLPRHRVRVVDNAVVPPVLVDRAEARAALGLADGTPVAVTVARLAPPKRPDLLVDAWAALPGTAVLLVVGAGPLAAPLRQRVRTLGLDERVRLLGERSDIGPLLAAADVFCLASDSEGMPMAVLEAMAAGLPVVASAVGGLPDGCGDAAVLVPPGSAAALRAAVEGLLDDPAARSAYAESGRRRVAERFSVEVMRAAYDELYADLLAVSVR